MKNKYDEFELILMSFVAGFVIGFLLTTAIWHHKCSNYEKRIEVHNNLVKQGELI